MDGRANAESYDNWVCGICFCDNRKYCWTFDSLLDYKSDAMKILIGLLLVFIVPWLLVYAISSPYEYDINDFINSGNLLTPFLLIWIAGFMAGCLFIIAVYGIREDK